MDVDWRINMSIEHEGGAGSPNETYTEREGALIPDIEIPPGYSASEEAEMWLQEKNNAIRASEFEENAGKWLEVEEDDSPFLKSVKWRVATMRPLLECPYLTEKEVTQLKLENEISELTERVVDKYTSYYREAEEIIEGPNRWISHGDEKKLEAARKLAKELREKDVEKLKQLLENFSSGK
ncbi:MAG: hypothetical protein Q8Q05_02390 [bacterium]|nr:hypothetical protein [bacterium]